MMQNRRVGLTLVELLVTVAIIGVLVALLLPAVQLARESARRASCFNNLHQIGIALQVHHDSHLRLPVGARAQQGFGVAWWVDVLPYLESKSLFEAISTNTSNCGFPLLHAQNAGASDGVFLPFMRCPSSPQPRFQTIGKYRHCKPSYVGIAGSYEDPYGRYSTCCLPAVDGRIGAGGVLFPNDFVAFKHLSDGLSATLAVSEASRFAIDTSQRKRSIDSSHPNSWMTGTVATGTPPAYVTAIPTPSWNITTVRYPPGMQSYESPGVLENHGPNNPLLSGHPSGVCAVFADGSTHFLVNSISMPALHALATRDDQAVTP